jgi:hypothetical protein
MTNDPLMTHQGSPNDARERGPPLSFGIPAFAIAWSFVGHSSSVLLTMSTDPPPPPDPDPGFEPVEEGYTFADPEPPPARPPVPLPPADDLPTDHELSLEEETRPRRRRRRRPGGEGGEPEAGPEEPPREPGDRILSRPEEPPPATWWAVPAGLLAVGFLLCLVPIAVLVDKLGAAAGAGLLALLVVGLLVQLAAVTVLLMAIGHLFGIDYGPAAQAVLKLAAVVAVVDGLSGVFFLCSPFGPMAAAIIGAGVFQYLFRLSVHELLLSVAAMVGAAWILNYIAFGILADKAMKKNGPSGFRLPSGGQKATVYAPALTLPSRPDLVPPPLACLSEVLPCSLSGVAASGSATASAAGTSSRSARSAPA